MIAIIAQRKGDNIPFRIPQVYYYSEKDANNLDILTRRPEYVEFEKLNEHAIDGEIYVLNALNCTADVREKSLYQILARLNVSRESSNYGPQDTDFSISLREIKYIGNDILYIFRFSARHRVYEEKLNAEMLLNHISRIKGIWLINIDSVKNGYESND